MKKFKLKNFSDKSTYQVNILDIWYQNDKVVAYVQGSEIYKIEIIINNNRITNYYCSCPSSDGGMSFCKHLSGVEKYINSHELLELEYIKQKEDELDFNLSPHQILTKFESGINNFLDEDNSVNCYQSSLFSDYFFKHCIYIDNFLDNNDPDDAFYLVTNFIKCLDKIYIYNQDDKSDIYEILVNYLSLLATKYHYFDDIKKFLQTRYKTRTLDELGEDILDKILPLAQTKEEATSYISLLKQIKLDSYQKKTMPEKINNLSKVK